MRACSDEIEATHFGRPVMIPEVGRLSENWLGTKSSAISRSKIIFEVLRCQKEWLHDVRAERWEKPLLEVLLDAVEIPSRHTGSCTEARFSLRSRAR